MIQPGIDFWAFMAQVPFNGGIGLKSNRQMFFGYPTWKLAQLNPLE